MPIIRHTLSLKLYSMLKSFNFGDFQQRKIDGYKDKTITFKRIVVPHSYDAMQFSVHCIVRAPDAIDFLRPIIPIPNPYGKHIEEGDLNWSVTLDKNKELYLQIVPPEHLLDNDLIITSIICEIS